MFPTKRLFVAFDRLSANEDFVFFLEWLKSKQQDRIDRLLLNSNTVSVHQDQGYALALTDILQMAASAKESLIALDK